MAGNIEWGAPATRVRARRSQSRIEPLRGELHSRYPGVDFGVANITKYPGNTTPGIARNAYGLLGAGSVLFEMRDGIGTRSNGYIAKTADYAAKSVVEAAADGFLFVADIAIADDLPKRGGFIGAPNEESGE